VSYLPSRNRPLPSALSSVVRYRPGRQKQSMLLRGNVIPDRDSNRSRPGPTLLAGACCASCAHGRPCAGGPPGPLLSMGDVVTDQSAQLVPMVASIQESAQQYVRNDLLYRKLQIAATLAIPLAAMITKGIFHWRRGRPLL
jgi:hypothetical protein